ncbi:MAG: cell envelope integrity protein CreD [Thalassobaculum sp.]|uniref:cell envelope integrity protein CreD n=1 Tax=Thalassobaculum sp. TaxID=2022740 RepID=UPI0032EDC83C
MTTNTGTDGTTGKATGSRRLRAFLSRDRTTKTLGLAAMLIGFLVALEQVDGLVAERQWMRNVARDAVGALWGPAQHLAGPFLIVPVDRVSGSGDTLRAETAYRVISPRELDVAVVLETETRHRGLFEVPVYTATATIGGRFAREDFAGQAGVGLRPPVLALRMADAAGVVGTPEAGWNGTAVPVDPDLAAAAKTVLGDQAIAATLPAAVLSDEANGRFVLTVGLRGTGQFHLAPSGRSTTVAMRSPWPHPSFTGSRTTASHEITTDGFEATWEIGPFGRGTPSSWTTGSGPAAADGLATLEAAAFGVALVQPVDPYRMTERTLKYGMLFALYTFGAFVLLETVFRRPLHWLHYLLTGASVACFFLLLLSLSELLGFAAAYALGAAGVVAQTGLYARAVLAELRLSLVFGGLLAGLYAGLYGLLRLEDTALVAGSVGLFAAIGLAMLLTRRLNRRPAEPVAT